MTAEPTARDDDGARELARRMAEAAGAGLDTLDPQQRRIATGAAPGSDASDAERRRWSYTPTDHGGLTSHEQRPAQQRAAERLVASGLSMAGYVTVATIVGPEDVLDRVEGFATRFDRERGRDPGRYHLRVFGQPGGSRPWGWRFGGHHVSLNNLVVDGAVVATTPCFLGADPVAAPSDLVTANRTTVSPGDRVIPLAGIWRDEQFPDPAEQAKLQALSDAIDEAAGLAEAEHGAVEYTADPQGVAAAELDAEQRAVLRALLRALLGTYLDRVPAEVSVLSRYDADDALDAVHVAWAGPTAPGEPHHYRMQGPRLLVEWDNTQRGANHAHSVWRDPGADFGLDVLARHRAAAHA